VRWEPEEFSGIALRHVRVDRGYQYALDEARERAAQFGIRDDRTEVLDHWRDARSWLTPPVMVSGEVMGTNIGYLSKREPCLIEAAVLLSHWIDDHYREQRGGETVLSQKSRLLAHFSTAMCALDPTVVSPAAKWTGGKHPTEGFRMIGHGDRVFRTSVSRQGNSTYRRERA